MPKDCERQGSSSTGPSPIANYARQLRDILHECPIRRGNNGWEYGVVESDGRPYGLPEVINKVLTELSEYDTKKQIPELCSELSHLLYEKDKIREITEGLIEQIATRHPESPQVQKLIFNLTLLLTLSDDEMSYASESADQLLQKVGVHCDIGEQIFRLVPELVLSLSGGQFFTTVEQGLGGGFISSLNGNSRKRIFGLLERALDQHDIVVQIFNGLILTLGKSRNATNDQCRLLERALAKYSISTKLPELVSKIVPLLGNGRVRESGRKVLELLILAVGDNFEATVSGVIQSIPKDLSPEVRGEIKSSIIEAFTNVAQEYCKHIHATIPPNGWVLPIPNDVCVQVLGQLNFRGLCRNSRLNRSSQALVGQVMGQRVRILREKAQGLDKDTIAMDVSFRAANGPGKCNMHM